MPAATQLPLLLPEPSTSEPATDVAISTTEQQQTDLEHILASGPQLDLELARRAHTWTSWTPEKRAEQAQEECEGHIRGVYEALAPLAKTEAQRAVLVEELTRYKAGYLARYHAMLEARSRTASPMITGRSNFPAARNAKRMETERRRGDELLEWQERAQAAIKRAILEARTPEQIEEDAFARLKRDIDRNLDVVTQIDSGEGRFAGFTRSSFVTSTVDKIRRLAEAGDAGTVTRALAYICERQANMRKPFIADRNSIWRVLEEAQTRQVIGPASKSGEELIVERDGLRAICNHDLDRLQLFFDAIPPASVRQQLKRSGWHWSPSHGAWQRKITSNAEYALRQFLEGQGLPREQTELAR